MSTGHDHDDDFSWDAGMRLASRITQITDIQRTIRLNVASFSYADETDTQIRRLAKLGGKNHKDGTKETNQKRKMNLFFNNPSYPAAADPVI